MSRRLDGLLCGVDKYLSCPFGRFFCNRNVLRSVLQSLHLAYQRLQLLWSTMIAKRTKD
jgi:hypothetical protein